MIAIAIVSVAISFDSNLIFPRLKVIQIHKQTKTKSARCHAAGAFFYYPFRQLPASFHDHQSLAIPDVFRVVQLEEVQATG